MLRRQKHQSALDYANLRINEYKEKLIDVEDMISELTHRGTGAWMVGEKPMYLMLVDIEDQLTRYLRGKVQQVGFVEAQNKQSDEDEAWRGYNDKAIKLCGMPLKVLR